MFCPNCGEENRSDQNYCRSCGLKLDAISQYVGEQFPTQEYARLQRRKANFEKLGLVSISIAGIVGFSLLVAKAAFYKIILFGEDLIIGSALVALFVFGLLSVFFFNYPKLFMKFEKINPRLSPPDTSSTPLTTAKLIDDRPFERVPTVTESTTELLVAADKKYRSQNEN